MGIRIYIPYPHSYPTPHTPQYAGLAVRSSMPVPHWGGCQEARKLAEDRWKELEEKQVENARLPVVLRPAGCWYGEFMIHQCRADGKASFHINIQHLLAPCNQVGMRVWPKAIGLLNLSRPVQERIQLLHFRGSSRAAGYRPFWVTWKMFVVLPREEEPPQMHRPHMCPGSTRNRATTALSAGPASAERQAVGRAPKTDSAAAPEC